MIENPLHEVSPLIGLLQSGVEFILFIVMHTAYAYETIGGNYTRLALQEILNQFLFLT